MLKPIFCLMGPTASGKTALSFELAKHFPIEIISVDSTLIYREMNIGTAKPTVEELKLVPHHLIDILDPTESYSAAQFCEDAKKLIKAISDRGNYPFLVGGTMLYYHALQQGLSTLPAADEKIREELLTEAMLYGWEHLHQKLKEVDPPSAAKIHQNDSQRIQRALEVYRLSGKPLSSFFEAKKEKELHFFNLSLLPEDRAWLHQRIASRFQEMLNQGLVYEVAEILQKWQLSSDCPSMKSVGYRQVIDYLAGDYDYTFLAEKGIAATRQLAKRQMTWLRNWKAPNYVYACDKKSLSTEVIAKVNEILAAFKA
ncbi:MAG: tRNA (adenosine(37)-N6)-dimethylallyltransferase MiaA [Proteobacteria bacterium]|nr:tRNA (adenosine(37)-N6)-dimethylallyltransferase MiaA [Pseudomonadota bacterium]